MSDVFISYARSTEPDAERIDEALSDLGYSVWRDKALPLHRPYPQVLEERLQSAKAVIVLWSKDAAVSDWVRAEAEVARTANKLVQVSVDETLPPMPFNQIQCGALTEWSGDLGAPTWRKLIESLAVLVGPPDRPAQAVAAPVAAAPLLAVLPFDNLSGDPELLYFSDGVSEEILQTVGKSAGLRVIGRSSSFQFRGREKAARHVAAELGCSHVLDGSVRRSGARVRISAQLVECHGQTTLWSDRFDRELADVFALQDEIAAAVAEALEATFAPSAPQGRIDPVAFDLYLRARASTPGFHGAFDAECLRQAIRRAPGFAQAWAALAISRALQAEDAEYQGADAAREEARAAADRALSLDATSAAAYAALALLEPICGRFVEREALFDKALAVAPNDQLALEKYSRWLHGVGRSREALALITHAYALDPLYHQGANWYAVMIANEGRAEEAHEVWRQAREHWPQFDILYVNPLNIALGRRDWGKVDELIALIRRSGLDTANLREALERAKTARRTDGEPKSRLVERLRAELKTTGTVSLWSLVIAHAAGYAEEAFELADKASFEHLFRAGGRLLPGDYGLHVLFIHGMPIRKDVRFVGLCARLGLCGYWVTSGRWPDCADTRAATYDFRAESRRLAVLQPA